MGCMSMVKQVLHRTAAIFRHPDEVRPVLQSFREKWVCHAEYDRHRALLTLRKLLELAVVDCEVGACLGRVWQRRY